ncbi:MAG: lipoyl(octanoyl) transferase [Planctomycetaceae bacterium]|nr:lipoyl(octanoyl) transferase [Planctomycetaceae bacterium]
MSASATIWDVPREPALEVHLLGLVDFDSCLALQELLTTQIAAGTDGHGSLLICEHPPLVTVGREGSRDHILCPPEELTSRQMEVRWMNRGGGCVVHVPGQLAVYPILPLDRRGLGLAAYRERLEQAVIDTCGELRVAAWREPDTAGVWSRGGQLAQVGVTVRSWVSSHGLFLNVNPRMDALRLVRSVTGRLTSLAAERRTPTAMSAVRESLIRRLAARLDYDRYHLSTGHPLLRRTRRVMAYA